MLQIILYAYIDEGQVSYSNLEKFCEERTPYMLIANGEMPSANCFCSFVNEYLIDTIDNIFFDIVLRLIKIMCISTAIIFIDGTKFESVANKYTFVWKKCILTNRDEYEDFARITNLLDEVNMTAYALNVWTNKMILGNKINKEKYLKINLIIHLTQVLNTFSTDSTCSHKQLLNTEFIFLVQILNHLYTG